MKFPRTTSVRLHGDKRRAKALADANIERLLMQFRRFNELGGLQQNMQRVNFFDDLGRPAGTMLLRTFFGTETVDVESAPVEAVRREEQEQEQERICPCLKGMVIEPTSPGSELMDYFDDSSAYDRKYSGYFIFLDGYFSENVMFVPHEFDMSTYDTDRSLQLWEPLNRPGQIQSLSSLGFERATNQVYYERYRDGYEDQIPNGANSNLAYITDDWDNGPYFYLEGAIEGSYGGAPEWYELHAKTQGFLGAVFDSRQWCGVLSYSTRAGFDADIIFFSDFHRPGHTQTLVDPWAFDNPGAFFHTIDNVGDSLRLNDNTGADYRKGDQMYVMDGNWIAADTTRPEDGSIPQEPRVMLASPAYKGGSEVQWLHAEDLANMASAQATIDGTTYTVNPSVSRHDWVLVS